MTRIDQFPAAHPDPDDSPRRVRYGRIAFEVLIDPRLCSRDVHIYGLLSASCWQGSVASIGKRLIAKQAHCAERKVLESIMNLEDAGHLRRCPRRLGQRGRYELLSPVFGQKQRAGIEDVIRLPDGRARLATVRATEYLGRQSRRPSAGKEPSR